MAIFEVKALDEALLRLGNLANRDLTLLMWVGNKPDCSPIVRMFRLVIPTGIPNDVGSDIFVGLNSKVCILGILDEHRNVYRIISAEEFAKKTCEVVKNGKHEKGKS